jgi:hypothetical protein
MDRLLSNASNDLCGYLAVTMKPPNTLMKEMKAAAAASPSTVLVG